MFVYRPNTLDLDLHMAIQNLTLFYMNLTSFSEGLGAVPIYSGGTGRYMTVHQKLFLSEERTGAFRTDGTRGHSPHHSYQSNQRARPAVLPSACGRVLSRGPERGLRAVFVRTGVGRDKCLGVGRGFLVTLSSRGA